MPFAGIFRISSSTPIIGCDIFLLLFIPDACRFVEVLIQLGGSWLLANGLVALVWTWTDDSQWQHDMIYPHRPIPTLWVPLLQTMVIISHLKILFGVCCTRSLQFLPVGPSCRKEFEVWLSSRTNATHSEVHQVAFNCLLSCIPSSVWFKWWWHLLGLATEQLHSIDPRKLGQDGHGLNSAWSCCSCCYKNYSGAVAAMPIGRSFMYRHGRAL